MASVSKVGERSSAVGIGALLVLLLVAVVSVPLILLGGPSPAAVEIEDGSSGLFWATPDSIGVGVAAGERVIAEIDPATGEERWRRSDIGSPDMYRLDGSVWSHRCEDESSLDGRLLRLDGATGQTLDDIEIIGSCADGFRFFHGDKLWTAVTVVDLATARSASLDRRLFDGLAHDGRAWFVTGVGEVVRADDDRLVSIGGPWQDDLQLVPAQDRLRYQDAVGPVLVTGVQPSTFYKLKSWDERLWVSSVAEGRALDEASVLDPQTGLLGEPRDIGDVPSLTVEGDGVRLELYGPGWFPDAIGIESETWRVIDTTTGEYRGDVEFGDHLPRAIVDETLWLTHHETGEVSRMALADAIG